MTRSSKTENESRNVKVGKLKVNKETVRNLTSDEVKSIRGGQVALPEKKETVGSGPPCVFKTY